MTHDRVSININNNNVLGQSQGQGQGLDMALSHPKGGGLYPYFAGIHANRMNPYDSQVVRVRSSKVCQRMRNSLVSLQIVRIHALYTNTYILLVFL